MSGFISSERGRVAVPIIRGIYARRYLHRRQASFSALLHHQYLGQVAIFLRIVDSVAHHEPVFKGKTDIVAWNFSFPARLFV